MEGDEWMVDRPRDVNDIIVTSWSANCSHPTTNEQLTAPTSPKTMPTTWYDPPMLPESVQPPATPLYWCNPVTMTLEQIKENS